MKTLIADDDFESRMLLKQILKPFGDCDVVIDGEEATQAFKMSLDEKKPYDLVCLDIMMPNMDGHQAAAKIREIEKENGVKAVSEVKIIMITALGNPANAIKALYKGGATSYIVKPLDRKKLLWELKSLNLIK